MIQWRRESPFLLLLVGMFALAFVRWGDVPAQLPVHWNLFGEPDDFGGRFEALIVPPLIATGVYALLLVLPRFDPGRANYQTFSGTYFVLRLAILGFFFAMYMLLHIEWTDPAMVHLTGTISILAGALFILLGGMMGKLRPNWFIGIRTPWTLSSKRAWARTHRFSGWLFMAVGVVVIAVGLVQPHFAGPVIVGGGIGAGAVGAAYSYFAWRTDPDAVAPAGTRPHEG